MHPTDRKIFKNLIRLLRRRRGGSKPSDEFPSPMDMIEPTPPARTGESLEDDENAAAGGTPFREPALKILRAEDLDPSELEGSRGWSDFTLRSASSSDQGAGQGADQDDADTDPIFLEVHNTAGDDSMKSPDETANEKVHQKQMAESDDKAGDGGQARDRSDRFRSARDTGGDEVRVKGALLHTVPFRETQLVKVEDEPSSNPAFNIFANPRIWRHDDRNLNYSGEVAKLYRDVFTPTRPKRNYRDFSGRRETIEAIIQAVEEERSHVVVLGEKSLGKTSLLNIVADCAKEAGYLVARMTGTADMTFRHFIMAILEQFTARIAESPVQDILQKRLGTDDLCSLVDPDSDLDVPAAIKIFQRLSEHQAIVLVDDFERVENIELKSQIRELMSVASDQGAWLSLMLFGRASRAGDILPESYQTLPNVTWIKLQPMSDEDAARVVMRGVSSVGVQFNDEVTEAIIRFSQGLPSALQWLCLLVIRHATQRYASEVEMQDLAEVVTAATGKIDARLSAFYDRICGPTRSSWADDVLYLAVQAPTDHNGIFSPDTMSRISQETIGKPLVELSLHSALSRFTGDEEGEPVLEKVWTSSGTCYRFVNPAMRAIVMLKNCGRLANMPNALLEREEDVELLPSPGASPGMA